MSASALAYASSQGKSRITHEGRERSMQYLNTSEVKKDDDGDGHSDADNGNDGGDGEVWGCGGDDEVDRISILDGLPNLSLARSL